ncbi:hypothetical protein [Bradyrhizobium canariense]|uniref:hypothetical protein n=1 Tax=Bradyrhizobium canariense TaxID=255045 RepID=UPI001430481E|nr:hypothetical protein [Bradyrhizobium canariense]
MADAYRLVASTLVLPPPLPVGPAFCRALVAPPGYSLLKLVLIDEERLAQAGRRGFEEAAYIERQQPRIAAVK